MKQKILGFDVSSSCIGYAVLEIEDNNIKFISCNYIKPIKKGSIIERLADTRDKIKNIIEENKPNYIGIEDIVQFMAGGSTAKTIIILISFNRMIGLMAHDYLGKPPELFSVMTVRHSLKLTKVLPKKDEIPTLVEKHLGIKFPYVLGKKGKIQTVSYDQADAVAVALHYAYKLTNRLKKKK
jgi:Holliday junction resolvasome RuvABC endonuclease subunit